MSKKSRTQAAPEDDSSSSNESTSGLSSRSTSTSRGERLYKSAMSGLQMPVPRIKAMLKVHNYAGRVSDASAVFLAATLEYMTAEILEVSRNATRSCGASRIQSKHVNMAVKTDPDLQKIFRNSTVLKQEAVPYHESNSPTVAGSQSPLPPLLSFTPLGPRVKRKPKRPTVSKSVRKSKTVSKSRTSRRSG